MSNELKPCPCCGNTHLETTANVNESNNLGRCGAVWCECGLHMSARSLEEAMARWNARAAVADEQLAMAVHDGRAWQAVRECKLEECGWDNGQCTWGCRCTACGDKFEHTSGITWNFCPNCGAKVVG